MYSVRSTPSVSSPIRRTFERAATQNHTELHDTIRLDTLIESIKAELLTNPESGAYELSLLADEAGRLREREAGDTSSSHTDMYRRIAISDFAIEKTLAPLFFGSNNSRARQTRARIIDGIAGKSVRTIEQLLDLKNSYLDSSNYAEESEYNNLRGALQEHTIAGLLNFDEDSDFIVLPASAEEDFYQGTDLIAYYRAADGQNYRSNISVKSSPGYAIDEWNRWREYNPQLIVLHAAQFNNRNFKVSRSYVDYLHYGDTSGETMTTLEQAALALRTEFNAQVERKGATPITKIPSGSLNAIEVAVFHPNKNSPQLEEAS